MVVKHFCFFFLFFFFFQQGFGYFLYFFLLSISETPLPHPSSLPALELDPEELFCWPEEEKAARLLRPCCFNS